MLLLIAAVVSALGTIILVAVALGIDDWINEKWSDDPEPDTAIYEVGDAYGRDLRSNTWDSE